MKTKLLALGALFASLCASVQGQTPLLHYSFESVSGTIVPNTGSGGATYDGTLTGTATVVAGGVGNCLSIPAGDSHAAYVAAGSLPVSFDNGGTWSWAMWIKTTTPGGTYMYQGDGGWANANRTFYLNNGSTTGDKVGGVSYAQGWETGTTSVDDGLWHFIAMTCNAGTKTMYVDGIVDNITVNQWNNTAAGALLYIGGNGTGEGDGQVGLGGQIDEVNVFDVTLSQAEIQSLYASKTFGVPLAVTVTPASRYRGQTFTVTATATPNVGTVTNATVDLSPIGLSTNAALVQASANVFTNTFTVPATAPIVATSLKAIVTSTEPLKGSKAAAFTVAALPPTNAIVLTPITPASVHEYTEVSFHFAATNDAPIGTTNDVGFPMAYSWYTNSVLVSSNMGPYYTFLTTPGDNAKSVYAIARVADTNFSSISVTSAVVALTVIPGTPSYTNGLKREFLAGASRQDAEIGNTRPGVISLISRAQLPGGYGDNYTERMSGYFIPPADDDYVFYVAADDDCDLFMSLTDSDPNHKVLIAQETVWSNAKNWLTPGSTTPGPYEASQKRSDQWSPDPTNGVPAPYSAGIHLLAGHKYYIESVQHNGGGGDNWAITYQTVTEGAPTDGTDSRMTAASNNIVAVTWPGTSLAWATDLTPTAVTVSEGATTNFSCLATNDAEMVPAYQWYVNNSPYVGATGPNLNLSSIPFSYNGAQIYVVAMNQEGGLVITSRVATVTVVQAVHEAGFVKDERWNGKTVADIVSGNVSATPDYQMAVTEWGVGVDNNGGHDNFARRVSGYFVPPATDLYDFVVTSDDDSLLFVSTDETAAHKRQVCSQAAWNNGGWQWGTQPSWAGPVGNLNSSTWTPDGGATYPYSGGIMLTQGQRYYIEQDMHQGGGGANLAATFTLHGAGNPAAGTVTVLKGSVIQMSVNRCSSVAFTKQPVNATAVVGTSVAFTADGTTDSQVAIGGPTGYEETYANNHLFYQWYTNGVAVDGANSKKFMFGPTSLDQTGVQVMCKARALGYTDDALNPIWTNSQTATLTVTAGSPSLLGHWIGGTASLADSANHVAPGVYDGSIVGTSSYFTNDVPPNSPSGAQSLYLVNAGIIISNTVLSDAGYTVDTFDGSIQNQFTIAFWAKGNPNSWNPWVSKNGESSGWQMRKLGWSGDRPTFTMRGSGGDADPYPADGFDLNQWHYYAGTFDATTGNRILYVDAKLENQQTGQTPYTLASGSRLGIGARDNGGVGSYFTGNLYDVRIYNYALTQGAVALLGGFKPTFTSQVSTNDLGKPEMVFTFPYGTLLQATNLLGPWTVNTTVSPATNVIDPTQPQLFFKLSNP